MVRQKNLHHIYGGSKMLKRYIVTNPKDVVEIGRCELILRLQAGKYEVQRDIAAFLYYPCLAVDEGNASYADVTAAFNYQGFPSKDGLLTFAPERLIKFFTVEKENEEAIFIRFNPNYEEDFSDLEEQIRMLDL